MANEAMIPNWFKLVLTSVLVSSTILSLFAAGLALSGGHGHFSIFVLLFPLPFVLTFIPAALLMYFSKYKRSSQMPRTTLTSLKGFFFLLFLGQLILLILLTRLENGSTVLLTFASIHALLLLAINYGLYAIYV